jgi:agmatinase
MNTEFGYKTKHKNPYFEIIPCPYDKTTSYGHGTDQGPQGIINASQELEFYDDEFDFDPSDRFGIKTLENVLIDLQEKNTKEPFKTLYDKCLDSYHRNKFPLVLGGEHSLSLGSIKAAYDFLQAQGKGLTLLHFDAHADLRQEYQDNPYNHACAIYSVFKACPKIKIVSVGIRNISQGECEWLRSLEKQVAEHFLEEMPIIIFYARDEFYKTYAYRSALKEFRESSR